MKGWIILFLLLVISWMSAPATVADALAEKTANTNVKIKMLVDKVFSRNRGRKLSDDDFKRISTNGFNTFCSRWHGMDVEKMKKYALLSAKYKMHFMPWFRGTYSSTKKDESLTYGDGKVTKICSPLSKQLWAYLDKWILTYAKLSKTVPISGVMLDFEIYDRPKKSNAYPVSYDINSLRKFAEERKITIPDAGFSTPAKWLQKHGLEKNYRDFFVKSFRDRCRKLREKIDALNPNFQIGVYNSDFLISEIFCKEISTTQAPVIIAASNTYALSCTLVSPALNIESNRNKILDRLSCLRRGGFPFVLIGGIDPVVMVRSPKTSTIGPEFSGKNAIAITDLCDGYWVFYEGPVPKSREHKEYMRWFKIANEAIKTGEKQIYKEPFLSYYNDTCSKGAADKKNDSGKIQIGTYKVSKVLKTFINSQGNIKISAISSLVPQYLKQFDILILQNFNLCLRDGSIVHKALKDYVNNGGAILFAHDSIWFLESPFKEIAKRGFPRFKVSHVRHVIDRQLGITSLGSNLLSQPAGTTFLAGFYDHMIFKAGRYGKTLVKNRFGDPVYVVGSYGKGKVAFCGSYYGYSNIPPTGTESKILKSLLTWLSSKTLTEK